MTHEDQPHEWMRAELDGFRCYMRGYIIVFMEHHRRVRVLMAVHYEGFIRPISGVLEIVTSRIVQSNLGRKGYDDGA